jgi:hypothetical protein
LSKPGLTLSWARCARGWTSGPGAAAQRHPAGGPFDGETTLTRIRPHLVRVVDS